MLDQLLTELCARGWRITVKWHGDGGYIAYVHRRGEILVSSGHGSTPSRALAAGARNAIEKREAEIEKMRAG